MRCKDCEIHQDDTHGEEITRIGDKHWLHLPSVPNERLCRLEGPDRLFLIGSFQIGTDGEHMQEFKHPMCQYK